MQNEDTNTFSIISLIEGCVLLVRYRVHPSIEQVVTKRTSEQQQVADALQQFRKGAYDPEDACLNSALHLSQNCESRLLSAWTRLWPKMDAEP